MPNLNEAVTEKEYNRAMSEENYPVIFGLTSKLNGKTLTTIGKRSNSHDELFDIPGDEDPDWRLGELVWRYVPLTKTIYWWKKPTVAQIQLVDRILLSKYGEEVEHYVSISKEMDDAKHKTFINTSHPAKWKDHMGDTFQKPSFQEWYHSHVGD